MSQSMTAEAFAAKYQKGKPRLARGRVVGRAEGMNKTEAAYARGLDSRMAAGEVGWYAFQGVRIPLATGAWYTPDFFVQLADGSLECHEIKGWSFEEASLVRIKVAARLCPVFTFRAFTARAKKQGGGWVERTFGDVTKAAGAARSE